MNNEHLKPEQSQSEKAGPRDARTPDNFIGVDDIGLAAGIQPEDAGKLSDVKPDPQQVERKH